MTERLPRNRKVEQRRMKCNKGPSPKSDEGHWDTTGHVKDEKGYVKCAQRSVFTSEDAGDSRIFINI